MLIAAALFVIVAWWASTAVILHLDGLPHRTFKYTMAGATLLGLAGLWGLSISSAQRSWGSAFFAFACALAVWAWQEVAFLLGYVTGPRREPFSVASDSSASKWHRARQAFAAVAHHEIALVLLGAAVLAITGGEPNSTGWWTFATLWVMRQSAKLNVFLGVRNLGGEFLPRHLKYLQSYFAHKPMNPLLPLSVGAALVCVVLLWRAASVGTGHDAAAFALVASLLSLAILEHVLLVLPVPSEALWGFALRSHRRVP